MTIEELRVVASAEAQKVRNLYNAAQELDIFIHGAVDRLNEDDPLSAAINPDAFIAIQLPIYTQLLTAIETASDALNTDALH